MTSGPPGTLVWGLYEVAAHPRLGGVGSVYPCLDLEQKRPVVLKTFRARFLPNRVARDRLSWAGGISLAIDLSAGCIPDFWIT